MKLIVQNVNIIVFLTAIGIRNIISCSLEEILISNRAIQKL